MPLGLMRGGNVGRTGMFNVAAHLFFFHERDVIAEGW